MLAVSGSDKFFALIRKTLEPGRFMSAEFRTAAAAARRSILERYYDIVVVNAPLQDESGVEFAIDTACQSDASVLLAVSADIYEDVLDRVTDYGILVVAKPFPQVRIRHAVRFMMAWQVRIHQLEKKLRSAEEKTEDLRTVDKAKFLLMEKRHMTEDEAHRLIGKQAMDHGVSRRRIAEEILDDF